MKINRISNEPQSSCVSHAVGTTAKSNSIYKNFPSSKINQMTNKFQCSCSVSHAVIITAKSKVYIKTSYHAMSIK